MSPSSWDGEFTKVTLNSPDRRCGSSPLLSYLCIYIIIVNPWMCILPLGYSPIPLSLFSCPDYSMLDPSDFFSCVCDIWHQCVCVCVCARAEHFRTLWQLYTPKSSWTFSVLVLDLSISPPRSMAPFTGQWSWKPRTGYFESHCNSSVIASMVSQPLSWQITGTFVWVLTQVYTQVHGHDGHGGQLASIDMDACGYRNTGSLSPGAQPQHVQLLSFTSSGI